jgi:hypothetical protein
LLLLSFFTFTSPRAAGTIEEVWKLIFLAQELKQKSITAAAIIIAAELPNNLV